MVEDQAPFVEPLAMVPAAGHDGGPGDAIQRSANHGAQHPAPPFHDALLITSQGAKVKGSCRESLWKAVLGGPISTEGGG